MRISDWSSDVCSSDLKELAGVFTSFSAQVPQLRLDIDRNQAKLLGVSVDDLFATLQSTFSSFYINDFNRNGRVYRVQMQADADYRAFADGLRNVYVRSRDGKPIPVTALAQVSMTTGPEDRTGRGACRERALQK